MASGPTTSARPSRTSVSTTSSRPRQESACSSRTTRANLDPRQRRRARARARGGRASGGRPRRRKSRGAAVSFSRDIVVASFLPFLVVCVASRTSVPFPPFPSSRRLVPLPFFDLAVSPCAFCLPLDVTPHHLMSFTICLNAYRACTRPQAGALDDEEMEDRIQVHV